MRRHPFLPFVLAVAAWVATPGPAPCASPDEASYARFPTLSDDGVLFTAEGDVWRVPLRGGDAVKVTSMPGEESHPAVSPDGTRVAYSATVDGPTEVYVMDLQSGAVPRRLTYEGEQALVVGWTADGDVLYATRRYAALPGVQLRRIDPESRAAAPVPLALASDGEWDAGGTFYFTRFGSLGSFTKRYQGGGAQAIWRLRPGDAEAMPLTADRAGTSRTPMPWRGRIYFVSDRDGTMNLWSMRPDGDDRRQHTHHVDFDVLAPSLRNGRIVYQLGADLRILDVTNGEDVLVPTRLPGPRARDRARTVATPTEWISSSHLSPTGDRLVITARGQVFTAPVKKGRVTPVAREPGVRYRDARLLPDGRTFIAAADRGTEIEVWTWTSTTTAATPAFSPVTREGTSTRLDVTPSPDGRFVAHQDADQQLWVHEIGSGAARLVAASRLGPFSDLRWSADGRWLAYVMPGDTGMSRIWIYGVADGRAHAVTTDRFDSHSPAWSPDGAWLYFLSERTFDSLVSSPWGPRQPEPFFDRQTRVYQLALRRDARSRFATREERASPPRAPLAATASAEGRIDVDGLAARVSDVPLVPGNYASLETDGQRLYFLSWEAGASGRKALRMLSIDDRRALETLATGVDRFELSLDRSTLLVVKGDDHCVIAADGALPADLSRATVSLADWALTVDPRAEWRQIFVDAWRQQRDGFYDRQMHGVDWAAMRARYEPLVERVTDRAELGDLIGQMVGELSALHMFVRGGDQPKAGEVAVASLGASLERDEARGGYRVTRVYVGDPDLPAERSPLALPHVDVREGDVVTAIDGVGTLAPEDVSLLLRDAVDREVRLRVVAGDTGVVRDVVVRPITLKREAELRHRGWELERRQRVEAVSGGRVGYVHLRAMTAADMGEWQRAFYPVHGREGLVIDLRRNTGGNIDSWLLSRLLRQAWFYWQPRVGAPTANMPYAYRGHIAVIVDQETASDGEAFAEGVRRLGLGVVIGTRTWGGEIWGSGSSGLLDRGIASVPDTGVFGTDGTWLIEGRGVEPDLVVDNLPRATWEGDDAQLDAAVAWLRARIAAAPVPPIVTPTYPDKRAPRVTRRTAR
jgi:tricorn protease